jgi:DNA-directed RNA polymerase beta' subunit
MVGVLCAQSYGERSTQGNLSHFHKAGTAGNESIVTRQSELMNASSKIKNPTFHIYLTDGSGSIPSLRKIIDSHLVQLSLEKLSLSTETILNKEDEPWYEAFYLLYGDRDPKFKHCISFKLNMDMLYEYNITLENLVERIYSLYTDREYIYALFSPECFGQLDLFFDTESITTLEEPVLYVTEETKDELCLGEQILPVLESYNLYGIPSIENVFFVKGKNWYVQTENVKEKSVRTTKKKEKGKKTIDSSVRFKQILALDIVDSTKTISNNIWDIYYTFGIEAVRQYMIEEFIILTQGINMCHILLLVDKMTHGGSIASMSRYSMRDDMGTSIFAKASFEETLDNFLNAAAYGQEEPLKGVSASIICAKRPQMGTGLCNLAMDLDMLGK